MTSLLPGTGSLIRTAISSHRASRATYPGSVQDGARIASTPVRVWITPNLTGSDLVGSLLVVAGPVAIAYAISQVFVQPSVFAAGVVTGVGWIAEGVVLMVGPARRLEAFDDGAFSLVKRRRTLHVSPGELRAIRPFFIGDWWRAAPMRVLTVSGSILYKPPPGEQDEVWSYLSRTNPHAKLASPHGWLTRWRGH